jgi:hypothetical protein
MLRWQAPKVMMGQNHLTWQIDVCSFGICYLDIPMKNRIPWLLNEDDTVRHVDRGEPLAPHPRCAAHCIRRYDRTPAAACLAVSHAAARRARVRVPVARSERAPAVRGDRGAPQVEGQAAEAEADDLRPPPEDVLQKPGQAGTCGGITWFSSKTSTRRVRATPPAALAASNAHASRSHAPAVLLTSALTLLFAMCSSMFCHQH